MKKSEASKAKRIIDAWLKKKMLSYKKYDIEYAASTQIKESEHSKGHWGVYIYTDGTAYDDLYTNEGYYVDEFEAKELGIKMGATGGSRSKLENYIIEKMRWTEGEHYFEVYGEGIIYIY